MSRLKNNLFWNLLLTVSGNVFPLLTFPYVTRVLGAEKLGTVNFALSVVDYFILFSTLGLSVIGQRYIPRCNEDREKRSLIFSRLVSIHLVLSFSVLAIYLLCIYSIQELRSESSLYLVGTAKIIVNVFLVEWLFQGVQDFRYVTLRTLVVRSVYVAAVFILIRTREDYDVFFFVTMAQVVINALVNWLFSKQYVWFRFTLKGCREYIFPILSMGVNSILLSFYGTFNVIVLGMKCGPTSVGYFTSATKLYAIFLSVLTAYNGVLVPHLNSLMGRGCIQEFKDAINKSLSLVILLSVPFMVFGITMGDEIIRLATGPGFGGAVIPFQIIMVQVLLVGLAQVFENQILLSINRFKDVLYCTLVTTAISAAILFLFVGKYAEVAAAAAVAVPHVIECILLYYCSKSAMKMMFPFKTLLWSIAICLPMGGICCLIKYLCSSWLVSLLISAVFAVLYYLFFQKKVFSRDESLLKLFCSQRSET